MSYKYIIGIIKNKTTQFNINTIVLKMSTNKRLIQ